MSTSKSSNTLIVVAAFLGASATLHGTPLTGTVNLGGSAAITPFAVDFYGNPALGCSQPGVGTVGCFLSLVPLTGQFATLVPGQVGGTIKDLVGPPISGNISVPIFMAFVNGVVFDLTRVVPGGQPDCATVNSNAPNVSCTPVIAGMVSPFTLTNSATGTNASIFFNVEVNAYVGSAASGFTRYVGAFTAPSAGKNIAQILADFGTGTPVAAAYSTNFSPAPLTVCSAPVISGTSASQNVLWPPNHKMVPVTIAYQVSDACDPVPACTLAVASNQGTAADWVVVDAHHVQLRSERSGNEGARTYTVTVTCHDTQGFSATSSTQVTVPHDQGNN